MGGLFVAVFALALLPIIYCEKSTVIRIVEEPVSFGWQNNDGGAESSNPSLKMRISPSNFSGPAHLRELYDRCFKKTFEKYEYELCMFRNITQRDVGTTWNAYHGMLGVWQEWNVDSNRFVSMRMAEGDACGSSHRLTDVLLRCGPAEEILEVTEPEKCQYRAVFQTPLVCHNHSLLVFPTLTPNIQQKWNSLLMELNQGILTETGYDRALADLFVRAGLRVSAAQKKAAPLEKIKEETLKQFTDLDTCNTEYSKIKKELDGGDTGDGRVPEEIFGGGAS